MEGIAMADRFCTNCGARLEDGSVFCSECGTTVPNDGGVQNNCTQNMYAQNTYNAETIPAPNFNGGKYEKIFVEPDENFIGSLGDEYLNSFLTRKEIKKCIAILSDKRVYLRGNMIDINSGKISRSNIQKTVDLEDVTGTGFVYASSKIWKIVLAILFVCAAIGCVFLGIDEDEFFYGCAVACLIPIVGMIVSYIKSRKTYFFIEYAGGCIKFDATIYALAESKDFEKQIRRAKNKVKENILNVLR
jgi:predicted nucleic acid-binding Zn ribbon protein